MDSQQIILGLVISFGYFHGRVAWNLIRARRYEEIIVCLLSLFVWTALGISYVEKYIRMVR